MALKVLRCDMQCSNREYRFALVGALQLWTTWFVKER
jgi:hypothetical protein